MSYERTPRVPDAPLPDGYTSGDLLLRAIRHLARPEVRRGTGVPLWSRVGVMLGTGSGYSAQVCRWAGLDPDMPVKRSSR
jgi:hypothetical protein